MSKDTKSELIQAAERLLAVRGIGAVTAMDIVKDANARNASAVRYHFGSLENLIKAVFERRLNDIDQARLRLLEDLDLSGRGLELEAVLDVLARPLLNSCESQGGRFYVLFLAQMNSHPRVSFDDFIAQHMPESLKLVHERIATILPDLPPSVREQRIRKLSSIGICLVADYARQSAEHRASSLEQTAGEISACVAAYLTAPHFPSVD